MPNGSPIQALMGQQGIDQNALMFQQLKQRFLAQGMSESQAHMLALTVMQRQGQRLEPGF